MKFRADGFDVWVFRRSPRGVEYLLLRASKEKADRWFGGSQFWQVPSHFVGDAEVEAAIEAELGRFELRATSIWAAEHTYTIYNRRYRDIVHLAVFAAEVDADHVELGSEHSEYRWLQADEAAQLIEFRGLVDGLQRVREFVTERDPLLEELRLA